MESIPKEKLIAFEEHLRDGEKSRATRQYYLRNARRFTAWLEGRPLSKAEAIAYKEKLEAEDYEKASVNTMLAALNSFFRFLGREDCHVKSLREQRRSYCLEDQELEPEDFTRLVEQAEREGNRRLALLMKTLASTGIRISELRFITLEAAREGHALVTNKGKTRPVVLLEQLREELLAYAEAAGIVRGGIFITRTGRPMDRSNIWQEMKRLGAAAGVNPKKVFPHNFRHLFARVFYSIEHDLAKLADILGHSSINTTRVYIITTWKEHRAQLEKLGAVFFCRCMGGGKHNNHRKKRKNCRKKRKKQTQFA